MMTILDVAALTGLTTRTLRWYDNIGLVVPERKKQSDYRLYRQEDLKKLQQVLFFKALGYSLAQIKMILLHPGFNRKEALEKQMELLKEKRKNMDMMIKTIALALAEENGAYEMNDKERFKGFDFSKNPYEKEARETWGNDAVDSANVRLETLQKNEKANVASSMEHLFAELALIRNTDPTSSVAQAAIGKWFELVNTMGTYTPEMFANLGRMYIVDKRFAKNIDMYGTGLARFMCDAMQAYARTLSGK